MLTILDSSKYFQLRITFAAEGSARMTVFVSEAGRVRRVASLQWSVFDCEMITTSGSGNSAREAMARGSLCSEYENFGW